MNRSDDLLDNSSPHPMYDTLQRSRLGRDPLFGQRFECRAAARREWMGIVRTNPLDRYPAERLIIPVDDKDVDHSIDGTDLTTFIRNSHEF